MLPPTIRSLHNDVVKELGIRYQFNETMTTQCQADTRKSNTIMKLKHFYKNALKPNPEAALSIKDQMSGTSDINIATINSLKS